jgi:hypothetical protein
MLPSDAGGADTMRIHHVELRVVDREASLDGYRVGLTVFGTPSR